MAADSQGDRMLVPLRIINRHLHRVNTLAWDSLDATLYLGGTFDMLEDTPITSGLAMWTAETGLTSFPGGGLTHATPGPAGAASTIAFEPVSQVFMSSMLLGLFPEMITEFVRVW